MLEFYLQCLSFAATLLAIFLVLKWYNFSFIRKQEAAITDEADLKYWRKRQNRLRFIIWIIALIIDEYVYFTYDYQGALYLGCMLLVSGVFLFNFGKKS